MIKRSSLLLALVAAQVGFIPAFAFAEDDTETNITTGRAGVLLERASDGLSKLLESEKSGISAEWAEELQDKSSDLCAFVQEKLEKAGLDDKDMPLCSVE